MSSEKQRRIAISEDWLAVLLGLFVLGAVLAGVRLKPPSFSWATDPEVSTAGLRHAAAATRLAEDAAQAGEGALAAAARRLATVVQEGERRAIAEASAAVAAAGKQAREAGLGKRAAELDKQVGAPARGALDKVFGVENLGRSAVLWLALFVLAAAGMALMGRDVKRFAAGFPLVYVLSWVAQVAAGNATTKYLGLEYVIFALLVGFAFRGVLGAPTWLTEAVQTEFYIKTGLVIMGAGILLLEILQAGALGVLQALLVVTVVWYACFYLCRRLRVDDEFATMLSTAVSICGVSAAIAACGAIQGDRKKLSYVTSLVLIVAVPMMVVLPWLVRTAGIPDVVGGAWIGGTLDTTGSVVAAGGLISEAAMKAGVIVKFSQNVLIGLAAFALAVWWTMRQEGAAASARPSARVIWERFPKFVIGFVVASVLFSFVVPPALVQETKGLLSELRTAWFALAFVSIGLETPFGDIFRMEGGRPALAFVSAQVINVLWTLVLAWLLFGGVLFAAPPLG
ncbi:YeiH family protein [Archangium sp.]|uniref:YeiH family protein n=1 Tax=Archangium sp. TaxID=1872627 RepID=UPI002D41F5AD|nr:putative sulfate exporter family transporter [Archangium sp.]HYO56988.1 putative sulfate exporter family transporter [Archangium sp.]